MGSDPKELIARFADQLNAWSSPDPEATLGYSLLDDAFVWSDEVPREHPGYRQALCHVMIARTRLVMREPLGKYEADWEYAKTMIPNWVGFLPHRCSPDNADAIEVVAKSRANLERDLERCERLQTKLEQREARRQNQQGDG